MRTRITIMQAPGKTVWVARITGRTTAGRLARAFLDPVITSPQGVYGTERIYRPVMAGLYQVNDGRRTQFKFLSLDGRLLTVPARVGDVIATMMARMTVTDAYKLFEDKIEAANTGLLRRPDTLGEVRLA